jgi:hypothetical protein
MWNYAIVPSNRSRHYLVYFCFADVSSGNGGDLEVAFESKNTI